MLKSLSIRNYALIDKLDIGFGPGFSVITGETGAGKSIILGAIGLLLGRRADGKVIKNGAAKCVVEAVFDPLPQGAEDFLGRNDLESDGGEGCIVRREITAAGKSRVFINDTPAPAVRLKELGEMLVDIHSQHQNLLLEKEDFQLEVVDVMAGDKEELRRYKGLYAACKEAERALRLARQKAERDKADEDYIAFQLEQLENAALKAGEQEELEQEAETLAHAEEIKQALYEAGNLLDNERNGIVDALKEATRLIAGIGKVCPGGTEMAARMESCLIELKDIARETAARAERVEFSPERLEYVNGRLGTIYDLQQKHRAGSLDDLLRIKEGFREKLDTISHADKHIQDLQRRYGQALKAMGEQAGRLTALREKAAPAVEGRMRETLAGLGIPDVRFEVELTPKETADETGADKVDFLFCANKNERPQPISRVASGGEIARVMLSLKAMISGAVRLPTIIFDEIDTGVSGGIAEKMAHIMRGMGAGGRQVISITHLPQIAACGDTHYKVYKEENAEGAGSHIVRLDAEGRVEEIAHMLSGTALTEAAINNAKELLNQSHGK